MKYLMFTITFFSSLFGFGQCETRMLGYRNSQNVETGIRLSSVDLGNSFLNQAGDRWNGCGGTTSLSTSFGQAPVNVLVEDRVGLSQFSGHYSSGHLQYGTVTLYTQYETFCCGVKTRSDDELKDELAHELGHALGVANSACEGAAMHGGHIQADGSMAPRAVTGNECDVANDIWITPSEDCDTSTTCIPKRKGGGLACCESHSPILIDIDRNGFRFGGTGRPVTFDLYGVGDPIQTTWVLPNHKDVFLVHDINGNGICDDGSELFGSGTRLVLEGDILSPHGFAGLAQFDLPELGGNADGFITDQDEVWFELSLWYDKDANGISSISENWMLYETPISKLEVNPYPSPKVDNHGNMLRYWAKAYSDQMGISFNMVDVFFLRVTD